MDSLTQIVLGASVGEVVLGKKVGNRAALWGAICGTIPDLDVIGNAFMGELDALITHRGMSHSILFSIIMAPLIGYLISRIYKGKRAGPKEWSWLAFWALLTHPLLDCFTTWGTQLFYPFSEHRVALNSVFVVDPFYTLPFLFCLLVALFLHREKKARRVWNWVGIGLSSFYLVLTLTNKLVVEAVFTNSLHQAGKSVQRFSSYPTPFNNFLWYVVAEEPNSFSLGYYSIFSDPNSPISYVSAPKNHQWLQGAEDNYVVDRLRWVSKDYFVLEQLGDTLIWKDLRFGATNLWQDPMQGPLETSMSYALVGEPGEWTGIQQQRPDMSQLDSKAFQVFWQKIWGE